ncbi:MAG: TolB-like 6-bladed beta-propeller domain-containing protein [Prevotellaceae bacterium]|nr:TolB-like 6-bladed beta-propeller domain-containing protein [Prevotellaceae bacterium]
MNVGENLGKVVNLKLSDKYLIVGERNLETQIQLIDRETKENYLFGRTGEGPGRLLQGFEVIPNDNHIEVYDVQKRTLFDFDIDSVIKLHEDAQPEVLIEKIPMLLLSMARLNEQTHVATGMMSELKRFALMDGNGEIVSMAGDLPEKKEERISDFVHAFACWGRLTTNRKESKVAACTNYAGIIQVYDCKTSEVKLIGEHNLFYADYDENNGNFSVTQGTRWGYLSIDSNDKYIFALYSGLYQMGTPDGAYTRSGVIHVFDWECNPVCKLVSDRKLQHICIDNDLNLYGYDTEEGDIVVAGIKEIFTQK